MLDAYPGVGRQDGCKLVNRYFERIPMPVGCRSGAGRVPVRRR